MITRQIEKMRPLSQMSNFQEGQILLVDKPLTWTSFDVVNKIRITLSKDYDTGKIKVGHAGTLDPLASGLLIVCTGKMTKQIDSIQAAEKEYTGSLILGATTPSYDRETEIDREFAIPELTEAQVRSTAEQFVGSIMQTPPIYSARKISGERAYKKARRKEKVKMAESEVEITSFEIVKIEIPEITFRVVCSKGTYIRSLAHSFGTALNSGAYLNSLRRTRIGEYQIEHALSLEQLIS